MGPGHLQLVCISDDEGEDPAPSRPCNSGQWVAHGLAEELGQVLAQDMAQGLAQGLEQRLSQGPTMNLMDDDTSSLQSDSLPPPSPLSPPPWCASSPPWPPFATPLVGDSCIYENVLVPIRLQQTGQC